MPRDTARRLYPFMNRDLKVRTKEYALSVIRLFAELPKRTETQVMGRQLLRSGTSVGRFYPLSFIPYPFKDDQVFYLYKPSMKPERSNSSRNRVSTKSLGL